MKIKSMLLLGALALSLTHNAFAQGTSAFTYQGRLNSNGNAAAGIYDFRFRLATDVLGNNGYSATFFTNGIGVTNGLFTTTIDFGAGYFTGGKYWLEVDVRSNGAANYTALTPLQAFTPTPYAMFASTAGTALTASGLSPSASTNYVLKTGDTMSGDLTIGGSLQVNGSQVALGNGSSAAGTGSTAMGNSQAWADYSTALGHAGTTGAYALAAGSNSVAFAETSVALGGYCGTYGASSFVAGRNNLIRAAANSTIIGGANNIIEDYAKNAVILGGDKNTVGDTAIGSLAAGHRAKAYHPGSFIWADGSDYDFATTAPNQVRFRATGSFDIITGINAAGNQTNGVWLASGGGAWISISDRNAKENLQDVDTRQVLEKVATLPLTTWNYKTQDGAIRHLGPMAQDFKAAFGLGESATGINTVDADGVALAAIQGLNQKLEAQLKTKEAQIQALEERLTVLEKLLTSDLSRGF